MGTGPARALLPSGRDGDGGSNMDGNTCTANVALRRLAVPALLLALFSSSGCVTIAMWAWALTPVEPAPAARTSYRSGGGYGEPYRSHRRAPERRVSGGRVVLATALTYFTVHIDAAIIAALCGGGGGSCDLSGLGSGGGSSGSSGRKRRRALEEEKKRRRRAGHASQAWGL